MSNIALNYVWRNSGVSGTDLVVLLAFADMADGHFQAWPSVETLARRANVAPRNVQKSIRKLIDLGKIAPVSRRGKGVVVYQVQGVRGDEIITSETLNGVTQSSPQGVGGVTNSSSHTVARGDEIVVAKTVWGDEFVALGVTPASPNPSVIPHKNHPSASSVSFTSRDVTDALTAERDAAPRCPDPWVGMLEAFALGVVDGGGPQPLAASMEDRQTAKAWHAKGATAALVREVAMVVTQRQISRGKQAPTTLRYIDRPIAEAMAAPKPSAPAAAADIPDAEKRINRLKLLLADGKWFDGWGVRPTEDEARAELNQRVAA